MMSAALTCPVAIVAQLPGATPDSAIPNKIYYTVNF